jgi:transcriptional regulator with XRE-family HTH domain
MAPPRSSTPDERLISGSTIRDARKSKGWTQAELGLRIRASGYRVAPNADSISRWERGARPVPRLARAHLEAVLGVDL